MMGGNHGSVLMLSLLVLLGASFKGGHGQPQSTPKIQTKRDVHLEATPSVAGLQYVESLEPKGFRLIIDMQWSSISHRYVTGRL